MRPLRQIGFRWLVGGQLVSNFGDAIYSVALSWYVLSHHGGSILLGVVLAAYGIPRAGLLLVGGHASDRFRPWTVMLAADCVRAVAVVAMAGAAAAGPARSSVLIPIAVVLGAGEGIFLPASFAIVPELLPAEDLQQGNALSSGATQLCVFVTPPLGGVLVAVFGAAAGFGIDALTFMISAATLVRVRGSAPTNTATESDHAPRPSRPTLRGLLARQPILVLMLATDAIVNLGAAGMSRVALPALTKGPFGLGASGYGLLMAAIGAGLLTGTIAATVVRPVRRPLLVSSLALLAAAPLIALLPYLGGPIPAAAALLVSAALEALGNVVITTAVQRWAPPELMGRVMALLMFAAMGALPVSVLLAGVAVKLVGPATYFPLAGGSVAIAVGIELSSRSWRAFGTQTPLPHLQAGAASRQNRHRLARLWPH